MAAEERRIGDATSGLRAFLVIDALVEGRAFGGIRVRAGGDGDALADARALARAMSLKCAFAGIEGGGAKTVVHAWTDRPAAMRALGREVEALAGRYLCGGDLGFTADDLRELRAATRYVACDGIADASGRTVVESLAAADATGHVAVQGLGAIGLSVARRLRALGGRVTACDPDPAACGRARELGCAVVEPGAILDVEADAFSPCAVGGVITPAAAERLRARVVCGGANNPLSDPGVAELLRRRGTVFVPDFVANAGALIAGSSAMLGRDPEPLLAALPGRVRELLARAAAEGRTPLEIATRAAEERLRAAKARR
jgi:leucine dehydrogenase